MLQGAALSLRISQQPRTPTEGQRRTEIEEMQPPETRDFLPLTKRTRSCKGASCKNEALCRPWLSLTPMSPSRPFTSDLHLACPFPFSTTRRQHVSECHSRMTFALVPIIRREHRPLVRTSVPRSISISTVLKYCDPDVRMSWKCPI